MLTFYQKQSVPCPKCDALACEPCYFVFLKEPDIQPGERITNYVHVLREKAAEVIYGK
jgi:hypothetical protein